MIDEDCCAHYSTTDGAIQKSCTIQEVSESVSCPACKIRGRLVNRITLKALLKPTALRGLGHIQYRFCATPNCDVVYYGENSIFRTADVTVAVWQKSSGPDVLVCYCFEHSEGTIRVEIEQTGASRSLDRISRLVREGKCACEVRNPQGTCCLGNVAGVIQKIQPEQKVNP